jgi:hypothetical protein
VRIMIDILEKERVEDYNKREHEINLKRIKKS